MARERILVFHTGSLGDTLIAIPALGVVRANYPNADITMLTDDQLGRALIQPSTILNGTGLIDNYVLYPAKAKFAKAGLLVRLWMGKFDYLVYLIRPSTNDQRIRRDRIFFKLAGIQRIIGMNEFQHSCEVPPNSPFRGVSHMTDMLLNRLAASGLRPSPNWSWRQLLALGEQETAEVDQWLAQLPPSGGRTWIGVGIGGKMSVNHWPLERYGSLVDQLIESNDVWPVIFGGPDDRTNAQALIAHWKRGYVACGALGLRTTIAAMSRCNLFVGNDTGTIHMAAAAGVRCVGVYSSRNIPGLWDPYGPGNVVLRKEIACEGCMLEACIERGMECILSISVQQARDACLSILAD